VIVLDTNVLSELVRPEPDSGVLAWVARHRRGNLCTTAITEAELAYGLALLPEGRRRSALSEAVSRLLGEGLGGRVLPFDRAAAIVYAKFAARRRRIGQPVGWADALIAAIARSRGAELLATRDVGGLDGCGVPLVNPWTA
jgi:predicted nucleic acid-binding protein